MMPPNYGALLQRVRQMEQTISRLESTVERQAIVPAEQSRHKEVWVARAYNDGSYPGSGNTFPVTFVDATFTESAGSQSPTVTERDTGNVVQVQNVHGDYIPAAGTMLGIWRDNGRWWTAYTPSGTGTDDDAFVRIKAVSGSPNACDDISHETGCYWSGVLVTLAGSPNLCADPWTEGDSIWIADANGCAKPDSLKYNDVYHARKVTASYDPGSGGRPLYILRHQASSDSVSIVKITGASSCTAADEVSSECVYNGTLQSADATGTDMCSPWTTGDDVYVVNLATCFGATLKQGERYIAKRLGSFDSPSDSETRDVYGAFGTAPEPVQLYIQNGTGVTIPAYTAIGIGDAVSGTTLSTKTFAASTDVNASKMDNWCVTLEAIADGDTGKAMSVGVVGLEISLQASTHKYVDLASGMVPTSYPYGYAKIVWVESTTPGTRKAKVALGNFEDEIWGEIDFDSTPTTLTTNSVNVTVAHTIFGTGSLTGALNATAKWFHQDRAWLVTGVECP